MKRFATNLVAISSITIKDIYRKKVFWAVFIFLIALASVFSLIPQVEPSIKLTVIELWAFRAITIFVMIITVFVAGFSLPTDIEKKQIHTLASKPISKVTILLGKYIGFLTCIILSLLAMGFITIVIIRAAQLSYGKEAFQLDLYPRFIPADISFKEPRKREHDTRVYIGQKRNASMTFHFEELDKTDFNPSIPFLLKLDLSVPFEIGIRGDALAKVCNPETEEIHTITLENIFANEWFRSKEGIPKNLISSDGRLEIEVTPQKRTGSLIINEEKAMHGEQGLVLIGRKEIYEFNIVKSLSLVFLEAVFILSVTVAASAIVSAPVSVMLGIFVFMIGSIYGFAQESLKHVEISLEIIEEEKESGKPVMHRTPEDLPPWLLEISSRLSKIALFVVPDFAKLDPTTFLQDHIAIPTRSLGAGIAYIGPRSIIFIIAGSLLFLLRDFS